jgi:hypothetical protein
LQDQQQIEREHGAAIIKDGRHPDELARIELGQQRAFLD